MKRTVTAQQPAMSGASQRKVPVTANRRKGPYLIYPNNNTQMTVLWQLDVTAGCTIAWGTDTTYSTGSAGTTEYGTDHQHKYNITGLTPGTKYYYRVTAGSNNWTGNFYAAPASECDSCEILHVWRYAIKRRQQ